MKCSNDLCDVTLDEPRVIATIFDIKSGNYGGVFCSNECAIQEVAGCLQHISENKPLASFIPKKGTKVIFEDVPEQPAPPQVPVAGAQQAQGVGQNDHFAWEGDQAGIAPAAPPEPVDPIADELNKFTNYTSTLTKSLTEQLANQGIATTASQDDWTYVQGDEQYEVTADWLETKPNADLTFVMRFVPEYNANEQRTDMLVGFDNGPAAAPLKKYNLRIDISKVTTQIASSAIVKHIKAAALDYAANNELAGVAAAGA